MDSSWGLLKMLLTLKPKRNVLKVNYGLLFNALLDELMKLLRLSTLKQGLLISKTLQPILKKILMKPKKELKILLKTRKLKKLLNLSLKIIV